MSQVIVISAEDILHQAQLALQIPTLIQGIVQRKIIATAAEEAGITIQTEDLQEAADRFRLLNKLESSEATWTWLQKYSLTLDDFEELVQLTLLSNKLAQHLFGDKVEPYFYENQLNYAGVVMYEVILDNEDLAMELYYGLIEEEISFSEVSHQYIQDKELRRCGGYLGTLSRQDLKPEIAAAVFASCPPQILKPVTTSKGVHLISVEEIIQPQLDDLLKAKILSSLFTQWLTKQAEQVKITINISDNTQVSKNSLLQA